MFDYFVEPVFAVIPVGFTETHVFNTGDVPLESILTNGNCPPPKQ